MTRRLATLLLLFTVLLPLAAACGDDPSKDAYEQGLAKVQAHLDDATKASRESGNTTDLSKRQAKLSEAHDAIAAAAKQAQSLDPPKDAKAANAKFAAALSDYADLFGKLAKLQANDPAETQLYSQAGEITRRLDAASKALKKAGYAPVKGGS
jgi:hypothetical protein